MDVHEAVLHAIYQQPLACPPGSAVLANDLGYITLGAVLETIGGARLDDLARARSCPAAHEGCSVQPGAPKRARCVATEVIPQRRWHDRRRGA